MMRAISTRSAPRPAPAIRVRFEEEFETVEAIDEWHCGLFTSGGETHTIDWLVNPSDDIEWHIVLHKFHHAPILVQRWRDTGERRHLDLLQRHVADWNAKTPPGFIAADVTGRRVRNWVYALSLLGEGYPALADMMTASLLEQVEWLRGNLHAKRNHRTLELFAIYIAGIWFGKDEWTHFAMEELLANARSDFLEDGVHVELSSHYHCIALRNFIEAVEIADDNGLPVPGELRAIVAKASHFARVLHKPDGSIPALSDADVGDYRAMLGHGQPPQLVELFPDGGYAVMRDRRAAMGHRYGAYLVLDCGNIGEGNHGHLDCLNFEFAACGRSLIVDPGRYTYHEGSDTNWRSLFRGTRAHNLIQIDRRDQTAYRQGPKRMKIMGPAPEAQLLASQNLRRCRMVQASAASAQYDVLHQRSIIAHDDGWWAIHDRLDGHEEHLYEALFQLGPEARGRTNFGHGADGAVHVHSPDLGIKLRASGLIHLSIEQGWVAPRYGQKHAAPRIVAAQTGRSAWFCTLLLPGDLREREVGFVCEANGLSVEGEHIAVPSVARFSSKGSTARC